MRSKSMISSYSRKEVLFIGAKENDSFENKGEMDRPKKSRKSKVVFVVRKSFTTERNPTTT